MTRGVKLYLQDVLDSIDKISIYVGTLTYFEFTKDDKTKDSVVRNLEIIGEAVKNIPESVRSKYPSVSWGEIIGMRNKIAHAYFGVDYAIVWNTIKERLPDLYLHMAQIINEVE